MVYNQDDVDHAGSYSTTALAVPELRAHYDWHAERRRWLQAKEADQVIGQSSANYVTSMAR